MLDLHPDDDISDGKKPIFKKVVKFTFSLVGNGCGRGNAAT